MTAALYEDRFTFYRISFSSSYNEKCFRQNLYRKSKRVFYVQQLHSKIVPFMR